MANHFHPGFGRAVDPNCAAADMDRRFLAHAANTERGRRLEDAERHRHILHGEKKRVRAEGQAQGFAAGKTEGMHQAMRELEIWDHGFQEGRASATHRGRSEQLRIEAPERAVCFSPRDLRAPLARRESMNHGGRRSMAARAGLRDNGHGASRAQAHRG